MSLGQKTFLQKIRHSSYIVRDHRIHGVRTLPGVALLDMIYRLAATYIGTQAIELRNVLFQQPIVTSEYFDKNIVVTFIPEQTYWNVIVSSQKIKDNCVIDTQYDQNMECRLYVREQEKAKKTLDPQAFINKSKYQWDMDEVYGLARQLDINHFVFMKTLGTIYQNGNEELMELHLSEMADKHREKFYAHPAFLDGSTFSGASFRLNNAKYRFTGNTPYIPFMVERFCLYQPLPETIYTYTRKMDDALENVSVNPDIMSTDVIIFDESGKVLAEFDKLTLKQIREPQLIKKLVEQDPHITVKLEEEQEVSTMPEQVIYSQQEKTSLQDSDSRNSIILYLQKEIGKLLKKSAGEIDTTAGFYELGLDSAQLLGIVKKLEEKLDAQLYPTLLFEYSNVQRLGDYLVENYAHAFLHAPGFSKVQEREPQDDGSLGMLFFEPVWREEMLKRFTLNAKKTDHTIILFDGAAALTAAIEQNINTAEVLLVDSDAGGDTPDELDKAYKKVLEFIQHKLQETVLGNVLLQVIADSGNKYVDALGGLLKTAYLENPKVDSQIITIDKLNSQPVNTVIRQITDEAIHYEQGTAEIYYKENLQQRYIKKLAELDFSEVSTLPYCKENGVYVITGGLGGLGLLVARHLASQTKIKLALIGRSKLTAAKEKEIQKLIHSGAEVVYLQADIGNKTEIEAAFSTIKKKLGIMKGIFHCAGVINDQVIINKNVSETGKVFNAKVSGIYNLDNITQGDPLDFFVVFSSISAIAGNIGQADYASANAFMDTFSLLRQKQVNQGMRSGKTITINWPLWAEGGMQIDPAIEQMMYASSGLKTLPTLQGLQALDTILRRSITQTIVFYGKEDRIRDYFSKQLASKEKSKGKAILTPIVTPAENNEEKSKYHSGDIAIIGVAGHYPMANTIEQFYQNLREGKDCITHFPKDRWRDHYDVEEFYKYGGFLDNIDCFDPLFFNISPRQAENMDPQARLFLQTAWEACEDAGFYQDRTKHYYPSSSNKSVGVFVGVFWNHYELFAAEMTQRGTPTSLGISSASIPNMVSYCLNFHGPSMAVDTMCSSALTSIHLACDSIRKGECHYAIAGGVNLVTHPHKYMFLVQENFLASDGRCRSFGEGGDGYVPGEGAGALLLTSLEHAEEEGYFIYGVIKGSALNHVGKTSGAMVPDPVAQSEVIADAIKMAGVDPRTISYVEAHGTGTSLGDPIEIQGLCKAYSKWTNDKQYCAIGSSKSNIGHLEAAAGIAGLTKLLLQFKYQEMFPSLHSEEVNPYIPFANTPFYIERNLTKWKRPEIEQAGRKVVCPRRAGLSSFGANGSNAHIVLEEYISSKNKQEVMESHFQPVIIPLSAKNEDSLKAYVQKFLDFLKQGKKSLTDHSKELSEKVQKQIISEISALICVQEKDIDPSQDFADFNIDFICLNTLYQNLQEKWEIEINRDFVIHCHSIQQLANQFIKYYSKELSNKLIAAGLISHQAGVREINLTDLAYTLQIGREAMEERLGVVAESTQELLEKLQAFLDGKDGIEKMYRGQVKRNKKILDAFTADGDMDRTLDDWMKKGKYAKIAELWVIGLNLDWNKLYGSENPCRISLPTYPFASERYWVPEAELAIKPLSEVIHPLVQQNTSDFTEQRFTSSFTNREAFLKDYIVKEQRTFPGIAFLEMARAAIKQAAGVLIAEKTGLYLENIVWAHPVTLGKEAAKMHISLFYEENERIAYEIYSQPRESRELIVHSQGKAQLGLKIPVPAVDIADVKERCSCCDLKTDTFEQLYFGAEQILAEISEKTVRDMSGMLLPPSLLDLALQMSIGLIMGKNHTVLLNNITVLEPTIPLSLQSMRIFDKVGSVKWLLVYYDKASCDEAKIVDIDLCDEHGNVVVQLNGLSLQTYIEPAASTYEPSAMEKLMYHTCWREEKIEIGAEHPVLDQHVVMLCETSSAIQENIEAQIRKVRCISLKSEEKGIAERYQNYAVQIFEEIKRILKEGVRGRALIQLVITNQMEQQLFSGLFGLLKTAQLENPKLTGQLIEISAKEDPDDVINKLNENYQHLRGDRVCYQNGKRYIAGWDELKTSQERLIIPWKDGGVYLITGGAGGLGFIFAREIAQKVKDATLILTGRSQLSQEKLNKLKQLETQGIRLVYRQVDVTQGESVKDLIQGIQNDFGSINGIIHGAGVVCDNFIINKTREELQEVLWPKVKGLVNLDEASKNVTLDFLICFSSVTGAMGNPGQSDYAAANAFMDQFASYRNALVAAKQRNGWTLSMDWPLWQDGGMSINPDTEKMMLQNMGISALKTANGIEALYQGFASGYNQVIVLEGNPVKIKEKFSFMKHANFSACEESLKSDDLEADNEELLEKTVYQLKVLFGEITKLSVSKIDADESLSNYGIDSVMITRLNQKLENIFQEISKTLFYEYQTINELAKYFISDYPQDCMEWTGLKAQAQAIKTDFAELVHSALEFPILTSWKTRGSLSRSFALNVVKGEEKEPIAIIGVSGRYPQAKTLRQFWENLQGGKNCITGIPQDRWSLEGFYHPDSGEAVSQGKSYSKWGGFIDGFADFDPLFFNISPREVLSVDPQERLFIESCWEVFEDAGYTKEHIAAKYNGRIGVFAGITKTGFELYGPELWEQGEKIFPRTSFSSIANRISYLFNLHGPSMPIDTMCSSSLTAVHEACEHLYRGECEMAIAGGVNLYLHPSNYIVLCGQQMLSPDGQCRSFGDGANGFVPGEGVGVVLLKPLSKAIADRDHIYSVVSGTSVNHGGKTNGYTVPNPNAQGEVIRTALDKAGVNARTVSYIEAHGTGTKLGDPIEITGLTRAFAKDTQDTGFCAIGSVKSNIGHLEAAAGIAGITKIILQIKNQKIAASLNAKTLNSNINFAKTPFTVQQELTEWKRPVVEINGIAKEYPRTAGISSFGAGGANAHVVIQEYMCKELEYGQLKITPENPAIIVLSAKSTDRLLEQAHNLLTAINEEKFTDYDLADMAFTLQVGREAMEERLALIVGSIKELAGKLEVFIAGKDSVEDLYQGQVKRNKDALAIFAADEDLQLAIDSWIHKKKYRKLLEFWVKGLALDWYKLYGDIKPRRISLPTYPFSRECYWLVRKNSAVKTNSVMPRYNQKQKTSDASKQPDNLIAVNKLTVEDRTNITLLPERNSLPVFEDKKELQRAGRIQLQALQDVQVSTLVMEVPKTITLMPTSSFVPAADTNAELQKPYRTPMNQSISLKQPLHNEAVRNTASTKETLEEELATSLAECLYMERSEVDIDRNFVDLGMDSIIGVEWIKAVNKQYGTPIPATKAYDYPTIRDFADYLARELSHSVFKQSSPNMPVHSLNTLPITPLVSEECLKVGVGEVQHDGLVSSCTFLKALQEELAISLAECLYLECSDVDLDQKFTDLGMDSIIGVEWIKAVNKQYGTSISAMKVYDYPTIRDFADYLSNELNNCIAINHSSSADKIDLSGLVPEQDKGLPIIKVSGQSLETVFAQPEQADSANSYQTIGSLEEELALSLAECLYMERSDIDIDQNFVDLGMDSIIGVEWIKMVNKQYNISIPATRAYDYPNIRQFAQFLSKEILIQKGRAREQVSEQERSMSFTDILQQVQQGNLNIDEADQLLNKLNQ